MLKQPKSKIIKKCFRKQLKKSPSPNNRVCFGSLGLVSLENGFLSAKLLEVVSQTIARLAKRGAKVWFRCFPNHPVTSKPSEVRMGKGKGSVSFWAYNTYKGSSLFEISGGSLKKNKKALISGSKKLPIKTTLQINKNVKTGAK